MTIQFSLHLIGQFGFSFFSNGISYLKSTVCQHCTALLYGTWTLDFALPFVKGNLIEQLLFKHKRGSEKDLCRRFDNWTFIIISGTHTLRQRALVMLVPHHLPLLCQWRLMTTRHSFVILKFTDEGGCIVTETSVLLWKSWANENDHEFLNWFVPVKLNWSCSRLSLHFPAPRSHEVTPDTACSSAAPFPSPLRDITCTV